MVGRRSSELGKKRGKTCSHILVFSRCKKKSAYHFSKFCFQNLVLKGIYFLETFKLIRLKKEEESNSGLMQKV